MVTWVDTLGVIFTIIGLPIATSTLHYFVRAFYNQLSYVCRFC
jgi:hypothetical protein